MTEYSVEYWCGYCVFGQDSEAERSAVLFVESKAEAEDIVTWATKAEANLDEFISRMMEGGYC